MRHTAHPKNVKSSWGERVDNLSPPFPYVLVQRWGTGGKSVAHA